MKTVPCLLCSAKETFDESECVFGLIASKEYFSLSGEWIDKPYVCIKCLINSEIEHETNALLAARIKAAKEGTKPPPFQFAVVLVITQDNKHKIILRKTLKDEDLSRYLKIFGIMPSKEEAMKLQATLRS